MTSPLAMTKNKDNKWSNYGLRVIVNTVTHPFEYAKVLIQVGYEPIAPRPAKTFFGKPALKLPNIFEYVRHIKSVDGLSGLYVGLAPKVCGNLISSIAAQKCADYIRPPPIIELDIDEEEETEERRKEKWIEAMKCDVLTHTAAIVISQPFTVVTVRMMARFVGKEARYVGVFGSIKEIYNTNGVAGFFHGLVPRILGDILSLFLAGGLTYVINRYLVEEKELKVYTAATMNFIATAIMYPFQVVSNCMAISASGLKIGSPPLMPVYGSWIDCWMDLSKQQQLKRGSSLLVRYYTGPHVNVGGKLLAVNRDSSSRTYLD